MSDRDEAGKFTKGNPYKWSPGQSGNPLGRPKGAKTGSSVLRKLARQMIDPKSGLSAVELVGAKLLSAAMAGEPWAIKEFYDRTEGRPGVRVEQDEITDWKELAELHGLEETDVIREVQKLLESANASGDTDADQKAEA